MLVASTAGGQRHGGGVRPISGNRVNVAVMSVPPKITLAHGSGTKRRSVACHRPNADP